MSYNMIQRAVKWSVNNEMIHLLPSSRPDYNCTEAKCCTLDGQTIFGSTRRYVNQYTSGVALRWDDTVPTELAPIQFTGGAIDTPFCCSLDGNIIYGYSLQFQTTMFGRWTNGGATGQLMNPPAGYSSMNLPWYGGTKLTDATGSNVVGIVGDVSDRYMQLATVWTNGVPSFLPNDSNRVDVTGISDDGTRIMRRYDNQHQADTPMYWDHGNPRTLQSPDGPWGYVQELLSRDGSTIYGWALSLYGYTSQPYYIDNLDATTPDGYGGTLYGEYHRLYPDLLFGGFPGYDDCSFDGRILYGMAYTHTGGSKILRWTDQSSPVVLPIIDSYYSFRSNLCSSDGWMTSGYVSTNSSSYACFWDDTPDLHLLPDLEPTYGGYGSTANGVSRDGSTIYGYCNVVAPITGWAITSNNTTPHEGAVGDLWMTDDFVDFSDPAVLSKFITPDGQWVYLGYTGELPTGESPRDFLTVYAGFPPVDFLTGYGNDVSQTTWDIFNFRNIATGLVFPDLEFDDCGIVPTIPLPSTQPVTIVN